MVRADKTLDIKGVVSPRTEIITGNTLAEMTPGQVLTVVTTDRTVKQRLPALCETLRCSLLGVKEEDGALLIQLKK